jgi:hypothetical protein
MLKNVLLAACLVFVFGVCAAASENRGAEALNLDGGSRGAVAFPHHRHQEKLGDCAVCHNLFSQEPGAIVRFKKEGRLASKQVMNKLCIKCHRAEKKAGNESGPVSCSQCHRKG